ncbi:Rx, N-terminal [Dillenia turbinata]|uniref:Rx, N-terminal n=1 Tax=Dillenia turbinata TaxID=194707 RepID=A0AAN8VQ65_9MAGN
MNHQRTILSQTNLSSLLSCAFCSLSLLSESEPVLAMGEPLLAACLQSLLDKLAPGPLMNFAIQQGFDSELRKWRSMLRKIKPVLGDAEEKQMTDMEVKRWLDDLLILAYDADDALDDLDCEALQQQNNSSSDPATSSCQLLDMLPLIKKITARFQDIEEQKSDLGLEAKHGVRSSIINKRLETTSLLDTSEIVGREQDVEAILKLMRLSETIKAEAHARGRKKVYTLPGHLEVSIVGKVEDVEDAFVINLMNKGNIEKLKVQWRTIFEWGKIWGYGYGNGYGYTEYAEDAESQLLILNLLEPPKMLRNLVIEGYCGVTLPNWIGDSSYSNLVELSLINCERCKLLPSLGQLPLLQKLTIERMFKIETMETELYGEASPHGQPFPSLTQLHIKDCKNLRTLPHGIMSSNSNLQVLVIRDCESLESFPSGVLPSTLKKLSIRYCGKLESIGESIESFPETPNLTHLEIRFCKKLKCLPSNPPKLTSLENLCVMMESSVEKKLDEKVEALNTLHFLPSPEGLKILMLLVSVSNSHRNAALHRQILSITYTISTNC